MVSSNHLLVLAAAFAGSIPAVLAGTLVEAAQKPDIVAYNPTVKRASQTDPYAGWTCSPWYQLLPIAPKPSCTNNNCYRAFLNARKGSDAFHCPSTAFDYCCQWYTLNSGERTYVVESGVLLHFLPWTANCGAAGPFDTPAKIAETVSLVDNVCACTLNHQVGVTLPNDYAALTPLPLSDPVCEQHL